jgi:ADP-heptose:LPS heptosyltransferase
MRIIIGLIEHIGDIIACEPVSRYVRDKYPEAELSWAVVTPYRELIDTNPHIDHTVELECLTDWIKLTKHDSYDEIIDLHVNYRVCEHCRIPLVKERGNPFVNAFEWFDHGALLEAFSHGAGLPKLSAAPKLYLGPEHVGAVDALDLPAEYCVIHRESNNIDKDWRPANWRAVAEWIATNLRLPIVEIGATKKIERSPLAGMAIDLVNRTPILQTAEVIRRARFFIGVDSGPAHMANAVQAPGVVLLGRLDFFRQYTPFTGFYGSDAPDAKMVRNLNGPAREIDVADVVEAVRYVAGVVSERKNAAAGEVAVESPRQDTGVRGTEEDRALVLRSGLFDRSWYVVQYPEVVATGREPLDHFLSVGGAAGFSPGPDFNTRQYLADYVDVARQGGNPLVHFLNEGRAEGRRSRPVAVAPDGDALLETAAVGPTRPLSTCPGDERPAATFSDAKTEVAPHTFAFYLPQFHPIAENNWAHGPGFTEWNNVIKAKPLFNGHYQPRIPGELGYYDLRSVEVMREQVRLATEHGITGFCFYYYNFQGKKLLYKPIENYINSDIQAPFFFLWANENWSKRWDGGDREVIVAQQHSREDDLAFMRELAPLFADDRYVKINGKPLLLVYKTHLFPNVRATTEIWRDEIVKHGFPDLYLVMVDDWTQDLYHPREYGFDAAYEIPSNIVPQQVASDETAQLGLGDDFEGRIIDYQKFAEFHMSRPFPEYKRFRTVMAPWDNTPRYGSRAMVHINTDGDAYRLWLTQALLDSYKRYDPEERIVFLHSWNEWCEGTYLEPDGKTGRRYLEETRSAIADVRNVIALDESGEKTDAISLLFRLQKEKDHGAFRVMQATRLLPLFMQRELDRVRGDYHQLELTSRHVTSRESSLEQALHHTAAALADARAALDEVRGSTSWRATSPLRWITRRLRGR